MTSLVIPVAVEPRNETLPVALWSAQERAPWLNLVLIGEPIQLEPYLLPYEGASILPFMQQGLDGQVNTARMLAAALESPDISDPFVWSNDDIYFLRDTTIDDIMVAGSTALKKFSETSDKGIYGETSKRTMETLAALSKPTWNYERHVPIVVHKTRMRLALAIRATKPNEVLNIRSVYQNLAFEKPAFVHADVKAFNVAQLHEFARGQFLSTGNRFPVDDLKRAVGYPY